MSYDYAKERPHLFSEPGQIRFMRVRDNALAVINMHGAFRLQELGISDWAEIACIDRMVELGELVEFKRECWGQFRVFTSPQVHNL